jgi:hypothetical protein
MRAFQEEGRLRADKKDEQRFASNESALARNFGAEQAGIARSSELEKQRMDLAGQFGLAEFRADKDRSLQDLRGQQQLGLARLKPGVTRAGAGSDKGALTAKNLFDIRKGLNDEFYGDNPAGEALRKHYGENGYGLFATQMMQLYQPRQQAGTVALPQPVDPSRGTISRGGQVIAGSTGGLPTDPEAFATQLKQGLRPEVQQGLQPVAQPQALRPAGMVQDRSSLYQALESPLPGNELFPLQPSIPSGESMLGLRKKARLGSLPETVRGLGRGASRFSMAIGRFIDPHYKGSTIRKEFIPMRKDY